MSEHGLIQRTIAMLQYGLGYYGYLRSTRSADTPGSSSGQETYPPRVLPEDPAGYPGNHRCRIQGRRLVPGYQLYRRANIANGIVEFGRTP